MRSELERHLDLSLKLTQSATQGKKGVKGELNAQEKLGIASILLLSRLPANRNVDLGPGLLRRAWNRIRRPDSGP